VKFAEAINKALIDSCRDPSVLVCGQLVKYGQGGNITKGLPENQTLTFPVAESLMNSATLGLALTGKRPVVIHERMEFMMTGPDALLNFIPVWPKKPLVILVIVGKGKGQGPQQSKDFSHWFSKFEGWDVVIPKSPIEAYGLLKYAIFGDKPVMYVAHRELFKLDDFKDIPLPESVGLCGASQRHEMEFYG